MQFLKKLFGGGGVNTDELLSECFQIAQNGHVVEAITRMKDGVEQVRASSGEESVEHAESLFHLGTLYIALGQPETAAQSCRRAADLCPDTKRGKKDRLTYLMNAGQMLSRAKKHDEAIEVLSTGLQERQNMYGPDHAGTAYGQQALADVMLAAGQFEPAMPLATEALNTFANEQHQETLSAMVTMTALGSASGMSTEEVFSILPSQSANFTTRFVTLATDAAGTMPQDTGLDYLEKVCQWAADNGPADSTGLLNAVISWSNLATEHGNEPHRCRAMDRSIELARLQPDVSVLVNTLEGKALLMSDIGTIDDVRLAYTQAYDEAYKAGLIADAAGVMRNWAIAEADVDTEQAAPKYESALQLAQQAQDFETIARVEIAYGVFQQHQGNTDEARTLLAQGIESLGPTHPDTACAVLHQVALEENLSCPCHGGEELTEIASAKLAERFFVHSGLGDLVKEVTFSREGENPGLSFQATRQPSASEMKRIQLAHSAFVNLFHK